MVPPSDFSSSTAAAAADGGRHCMLDYPAAALEEKFCQNPASCQQPSTYIY